MRKLFAVSIAKHCSVKLIAIGRNKAKQKTKIRQHKKVKLKIIRAQ